MRLLRTLTAALVILAVARAAGAQAAPPPKDFLSATRLGRLCWATSPDANEALYCWLNEHPLVAGAMLYSDATTVPPPQPWSAWPEFVRAELVQHFDTLVVWYHDGMPTPYPTPFQVPVPKEGTSITPTMPFWITEATGRTIYLSLLANTLAVELTAFVPWSITDYSPSDLALLMPLGQWLWDRSNVASEPGYVFAYLGPSPAVPAYTVKFLVEAGILAGDAVTTIGRLFTWGRQLRHYFVSNNDLHENYSHFWGPDTPPIPLPAIIEGTTYTGPMSLENPFGHFTAGCTGTGLFMKAVLHVVNIPVRRHWVSCQHNTPVFPTAGVAMTHGDDPYDWSGLVSPHPLTPTPLGSDYFVSLAEHAQLFPPGQDWLACEQNVGIQVKNVAIAFGSDYLMDLYCQDVAANATHASGKVYGFLQYYYPLLTLENMGLWVTLANKAGATGWCQP